MEPPQALHLHRRAQGEDSVSIRRRWELQWCGNPWLSLGVHFDHTDPSLTVHLPGLIFALGRLKQPGFRRAA